MIRALVGLGLLLFGAVAQAQTPAPEQLDDDAFIESLGRGGDQPLDARRLARVFFKVAANLDGGKSSLRLLQAKAMAPAPARATARTLLDAGYESYARVLATFQQSVSRLLDDPTSAARLYRALMDGQRACWQLDLQTRMLDTYGVSEADMISALSSLEACARFRTAAFQPRISEIVTQALAEPARQRERIRELEQEVDDLERLVNDLRRIDAEE